MPIISPPTIVQNAVDEFLATLFQNKPQRKHLANYLTGLMISDNKTVAGMTSELTHASDQSCLNRFLTEVEWDENAVNEARIEMMQQSEDTRFHDRGVIGLDDVLIDKTGKFIKDSGTFWDHSEQRYKHAQDLILINYLNPFNGKRHPLEFRRFKKADQCVWTGEQFKKMTELSMELIDWCHAKGVKGTFAFDSFYTCVEIQNHINDLKNEDGTGRGYVGDLKFNRKVVFKGVEQQALEFAHTIPPEDRKPVTVDGMKQWHLSVCVKMPNVNHKVRILILWKYKNDQEPRKTLVTNRIYWNPERIVETYRGRWSCTETIHRDGKQELGLGDCQLRGDRGQTRHVYMVFLAYSLLVRELDKTSVSEWACVKLTTIGESCRALFRDSIRTMVCWIVGEAETIARGGGDVSRRLGVLLDHLGLGPITQR